MPTALFIVCHPEPRRRRGISHFPMNRASGSLCAMSEWVRSLALLGMTAQSLRYVQDNLRGGGQVFRDPISLAADSVVLKAGLDADRAHASVATAFDIDFLVANEK